MTSDTSFQKIGQSVGTKLRAARLARKLTQSQLARPDFSVSYVSAIERGQIHPSLRALEIFAQRLGLSSSDLLSKQTTQDITGFSGNDGSIQTKEEVELQFLMAQLFVHQGAAEQAITQLANLTSSTLIPQQEIQRRFLLGWAYYKLALFQESESVLAEALKLAKAPNDYWVLRILNLLGVVHSSMHNPTQGLAYQQRCLDWLEKDQQPRDTFFVAHVYTNMGLHYSQLEKVDEAIQMFQHALTMTEELTAPDQLRSMYGNTSRYFAETNNFSLAMLYGHKSLQLYLQGYSNSLKSDIYYYLGQVILQGDQQSALVYLEKLLQDASVKQDQLALASVTTTIADLQFRQGKVAKAYKQAQRAYELAKPYGDGIIAAYTLSVLGQITYAKKDYTGGDAHFVAGVEMLERLDTREELAIQSAYYAKLLEGRRMTKEALKYFKKAVESRQKPE
jgi:tetratricopeptide (TPR) repeat protein